jgi:plasmid maintenance system antidote protein VapI
MTTQIDPKAVAIGRAVRGAIATAGLTMTEAAEQSHITLSTLSRRVNGALPFTFPELVRMAAVCGTRVTDLAAAAERIMDKDAA